MKSLIYSIPFAMLLAAEAACGRDAATAPVPDPQPMVLLKDIVIEHLPSPYYHFEYDATGRMTKASFASGLTMYDLSYADGRLSEMKNNILVNMDRLVYSYDNAGRVSDVRYENSAGTTFTRVHFAYDGRMLVGVERQRLLSNGFVIDKTMSLSYATDGNLFELTEHHPAIAGVQEEATFVDRYEQYETGLNVDGFGLLHSEFFDHLILLPQVQLQKGNPRIETRSGDGVNYRVEYTYTYDDQNRPLTKTGDLTILNGSNAGQHFPTSSVFSYY